MKWFYFHIFVLMFSSVMVFLFSVMMIAQCCMTIPNIPKEQVLWGLTIGLAIGTCMTILSIVALQKMIIRTKSYITKSESEIRAINDDPRQKQTGWAIDEDKNNG